MNSAAITVAAAHQTITNKSGKCQRKVKPIDSGIDYRAENLFNETRAAVKFGHGIIDPVEYELFGIMHDTLGMIIRLADNFQYGNDAPLMMTEIRIPVYKLQKPTERLSHLDVAHAHQEDQLVHMEKVLIL